MDLHRGTRIAIAFPTETHVVQADGMAFGGLQRMGGVPGRAGKKKADARVVQGCEWTQQV